MNLQSHSLKGLPEPVSFEAFDVEIDERAVFRLQGYIRPQDRPDARTMHLYREMLDVAIPLLRTRAYSCFYPIIVIDGETITCEGSQTLTGKNIARTFRGADFLAVGLVTIGFELEERVKALIDENELARGVMLDSIGSEAAEGAAIYLDRKIGEQAAQHDWRRTPRMSPGYGSFEITEQHQLFSLLAGHDTGVSLTSSSIMMPQKSVSFVIGCGPSVRHFSTLSPCRVCDVSDCPVRDPDSERCQQ